MSLFSKNIMAMVMGVANWYSFDMNIASPSLSQRGRKTSFVLRASSTWTSSWRSVPRKSARAPRKRGDFTVMDLNLDEIFEAYVIGRREVQPLTRNVAGGIAAPNRFFVPEESEIAGGGSPYGLLEGHGHEDAEIPQAGKLGPQQEDAVEDQHGIGRRRFDWRVDRRIEPEVEDAAPEPAISARAKRVQQDRRQCRVVERVVEVALGRIRTAGDALRSRPVEAVDRSSNDRPAGCSDERDQLVREGRLAGSVGPIYGDPNGMRPIDCQDEAGQLLQAALAFGRHAPDCRFGYL